MDIESLREYLLDMPGAEEDLPFGPDVVVFKVLGKMFALIPVDTFPPRVNLKCEPEWAIELRDEYEEIEPGYHQNKKHWNTVFFSELSSEFIKELADHSYERVVVGMTKKAQKELQTLHDVS